MYFVILDIFLSAWDWSGNGVEAVATLAWLFSKEHETSARDGCHPESYTDRTSHNIYETTNYRQPIKIAAQLLVKRRMICYQVAGILECERHMTSDTTELTTMHQ